MARLLTRDELAKRIVELTTLVRSMPATALVCERCDAIYMAAAAKDLRRQCWCDFESDRSDT